MFRDSVDNDDEPAAGIITETVGSYTDEAGNMVRKNIFQFFLLAFFREQMNIQTNEQTNERMYEWTNERMCEWTHEWEKGWKHKWKTEKEWIKVWQTIWSFFFIHIYHKVCLQWMKGV